MTNSFYLKNEGILTKYAHANIDFYWGPWTSVNNDQDNTSAFTNIPVGKRIKGLKFGVVNATTGDIEEYMFTKDNATDNDIIKLVLSEGDINLPQDIAEVFTVDENTQGYDALNSAVQAEKVIVWHGNIVNIEHYTEGNQSTQYGVYKLSFVDGEGYLHVYTIKESSANNNTVEHIQLTKEDQFFIYNAGTTYQELQSRGQKPVKVDGYIARIVQGDNLYTIKYVDGEGVLHIITHDSSNSKTTTTKDLSESVHIDADNVNKVFAIKDNKGTTIGSITLGTNATNGAAKLTFVAGSDSFVASLPNLAYDSSNQMLKMVKADGTQTNLIKLSNLQIKGVGSTLPCWDTTATPDPVSREANVATGAPHWAIGDLFLLENSSTTPSTFNLCVCTNVVDDGTYYNYSWENIGSINDVSLVAAHISFAPTSKLQSTNVQDAIDEVKSLIEDIERENTENDDDRIVIKDEQDNNVVEITSNGVNAKNLKSNGYSVLTEDDVDLDDLATKDDLEDKQDVIEEIEQKQMTIQSPVIEFRDDSDNYVGEVSPTAIAAKKFLIKNSPLDDGVDISQMVGGVSAKKLFGLTDIVHVIGFGQSLMAGTNSDEPVTTTQSRTNLFRFAGGVRPYDVLDLDFKKRVHLDRVAVTPTYLEMSDNKETCLSSEDIDRLETAVESLVPLTEQRVKYTQDLGPDGLSYLDSTGKPYNDGRAEDDTYTPDANGNKLSGHADGETPLSGFCEGFLNTLEKNYGGNFGFDMIATCCGYGSANFPSLCPLDRDGKIHNYDNSGDATNLNYFEVLLMSVKAAKALADASNKTYSVGAVIYMESNTVTGTGVSLTIPLMAYRTAQLFTLINQRIKAITKQSNDIIFLCDQSKTFMRQREAMRILGIENEITLSSSEQNTLKGLANYDVEPYDLNKIILASCANAYQVGGDRIHHPSVIQKIKGATHAEAYMNVLKDREFKPLHAINVKVIGNDIYVKFHVPVSPIVIDTNAVNGAQSNQNWQTERGNSYGFSIVDNDTYLPSFITSVVVSEPDTIKISCSDSPSGKTLEYCYRPIENTGDGTTGPKNSEFGNIRDSQGDVTKITIGGTDYPLHNWAIGFSWSLPNN